MGEREPKGPSILEPESLSTANINQMIVGVRGKYVLVFSILRDIRMRPIEVERTRTRDIDLD